MWFSSWLRKRTSNRPLRARAQHRPTPPRFRPRLEALDDRCLPSTLTVTNTLDGPIPTPGSLRYEISAAQSGDTIVFASSLSGQTITLYDQLVINTGLTIQGPGAQSLTISGGEHGRVFEVYGNVQVTLSGMTLTDGDGYESNDTLFWQYTSDGGAILNFATLTLQSCTVSYNTAVQLGTKSDGGGIYNGGTLTLSGSTVSNNGAWNGGGIYNVVTGLYNGADSLTVTNSTVTGNTAYGEGGGIYSSGTLTVSYSTVTGNSPNDIYYLGKFQKNHSTIGSVVKG
jgi:predicted outer membrane repeat protein